MAARAGERQAALPTCDLELDVAQRFLRLADLNDGAFERLGRYEAALWRQVRQTLFTLETLRWRISNARKTRMPYSWQRTIGSRLTRNNARRPTFDALIPGQPGIRKARPRIAPAVHLGSRDFPE